MFAKRLDTFFAGRTFNEVCRYLVKTVRRKSGGGLSSYLWKKGGTKSALDSELKLTDLLDIYEHASRRCHAENRQPF